MSSGSWGTDIYGTSWSPSFATTWTRRQLSSYFNTNIIDISSTTNDLQLKLIYFENKSYKLIAPTNTNEYWIIEFRGGTNFDYRMNTIGLVIWHVNENISNNNTEAPSNPRGESGYKISLEQVSGEYNLERNIRREQQNVWIDGNEFTPYTTPSTVSSNGVPTGIKLHNIRINGSGNDYENYTATFDVEYINPINESPKITDVSYNYNTSKNEIVIETDVSHGVITITENNNPDNTISINISSNNTTIDISTLISSAETNNTNGFNILNIKFKDANNNEAVIWNYHFNIVNTPAFDELNYTSPEPEQASGPDNAPRYQMLHKRISRRRNLRLMSFI